MEIVLITREDLKAMIEEVLMNKMPEILLSKPPEKYLTTDEAAEHLRVNGKTIRRWVKSGRLKCKRPGYKALYSQSDLDSIYGGN